MVPDVVGLAKRFDYTVPERWRSVVRIGTPVRVRLAGRRVRAWVCGVAVDPPAGVALQPIDSVLGIGPPPSLVDVAEWAAWRWAGPVATFLRAASPKSRVAELRPLPEPAPLPALERQATGRSVQEGARRGAFLVRLAPAEDPLPLVIDAIAEVRERRAEGSVLVMVPSRGWAVRLAGRLERRGVQVAADWSEAAAGWPVVVGARSAAWAPMPRLASVVVLDAHDEAYQEERAPTALAWEVAAERARRDATPCMLVSPCPTAELIHRFPLSNVDRSAERGGWPAVVVVDRRADDPRTGLFSEAMVALVRRSIALDRGPVVCVLNRRGRARLLACAACGELARCTDCGRPVESRAGADPSSSDAAGSAEPHDDILTCARCAATRPVVCAVCGAQRFKTLRPGVSRVREELEALLGVPVSEISGATPDGNDCQEPETPAVVGTEAALHRVRNAAAVIFLEFDQHLLATRLSASEDAIALVVRAGRMVGGRGQRGSGSVLVQTRIPDHPVITAAVRADPGSLAASELALRRQLSLPPFCAVAMVSGPAADEYAAALAASSGREVPAAKGVSVVSLGPERWLVRGADHRALCDHLARTPRPAGRLRVSVDPRDV